MLCSEVEVTAVMSLFCLNYHKETNGPNCRTKEHNAMSLLIPNSSKLILLILTIDILEN